MNSETTAAGYGNNNITFCANCANAILIQLKESVYLDAEPHLVIKCNTFTHVHKSLVVSYIALSRFRPYRWKLTNNARREFIKRINNHLNSKK